MMYHKVQSFRQEPIDITCFLRLTRMSGFTTWLNSPSIGHSLSGIEDSKYNINRKFGDEHRNEMLINIYSSYGDCESEMSNCDGFIMVRLMRSCVPFIGSIPTQLCIRGSENHIPYCTAYKLLPWSLVSCSPTTHGGWHHIN